MIGHALPCGGTVTGADKGQHGGMFGQHLIGGQCGEGIIGQEPAAGPGVCKCLSPSSGRLIHVIGILEDRIDGFLHCPSRTGEVAVIRIKSYADLS